MLFASKRGGFEWGSCLLIPILLTFKMREKNNGGGRWNNIGKNNLWSQLNICGVHYTILSSFVHAFKNFHNENVSNIKQKHIRLNLVPGLLLAFLKGQKKIWIYLEAKCKDKHSIASAQDLSVVSGRWRE